MLSCDCLFHVLVPYQLKCICLFYDAVSDKKTTIIGSVLVSYNKSKIPLGAPAPGSPIIRAKFPLVPPPQGPPLLLKHLTYGFFCGLSLRVFTSLKPQLAHWTVSLVASLLATRSPADPKNTFGSQIRLVSCGICGEPSAAGAVVCCHPS